jgi:hypothetical protein
MFSIFDNIVTHPQRIGRKLAASSHMKTVRTVHIAQDNRSIMYEKLEDMPRKMVGLLFEN